MKDNTGKSMDQIYAERDKNCPVWKECKEDDSERYFSCKRDYNHNLEPCAAKTSLKLKHGLMPKTVREMYGE